MHIACRYWPSGAGRGRDLLRFASGLLMSGFIVDHDAVPLHGRHFWPLNEFEIIYINILHLVLIRELAVVFLTKDNSYYVSVA